MFYTNRLGNKNQKGIWFIYHVMFIIMAVEVTCCRYTSAVNVGTIKLTMEAGKYYTVTYCLDNERTYSERVLAGEDCLNPSTFVPLKEGYTFVGWRLDGTASAEILSEKQADTEELQLYAVFSKPVTLSYDGNGAESGVMEPNTQIQYYNNGMLASPSFTLAENAFVKSGSSFVNWAAGTADGSRSEAGETIILSDDTTVFAVWAKEPITISPSSGWWEDEDDSCTMGTGSISGGTFTGGCLHSGSYAVYYPNVDLQGYTTVSVNISGSSKYETFNLYLNGTYIGGGRVNSTGKTFTIPGELRNVSGASVQITGGTAGSGAYRRYIYVSGISFS